ncbi:uncharacterized protein BT62DRAFT_928337 [Guyanagaster necrorhizus]|uniref:DASH complex subunit DAD2 n=1 Tax=Guyanagaster necrorhizus TaxID=856835 RepID=A0A9P8AVI9_9AGAR|nr:uncharacterized protein BT62DRAFT_928337 [Guyanagaster necrorhizus MCA 3950]KAG7449614.1 hypothetical protein BT62DRAFT_928337 [Guyanagaster necrorhizus MCA 3950]
MRQSVAPNRFSQTNSAAATAKLLEKKKEFDAVHALTRASALYLERIEGLSTDFDTMADAGQVFGEVLVQWPKMFQILNLFLASRAEKGNEQAQSSSNSKEMLVRIPIEELQQMESTEKGYTSA